MISHAANKSWFARPAPADLAVLRPYFRWILLNHFFVTGFLVVSGFCLYRAAILREGRPGGSAGAYYLARARRILPPLAASFLLVLAADVWLIGPAAAVDGGPSFVANGHAVLMHLVFLQDVYAPGTINNVLWSISVEERIYLVFPLFVLLSRRIGAVAVCALLVAYAAIGQRWAWHPVARIGVVGFIGLFAAGMFAAHVAYSPRAASALRGFRGWGAVAAALALGFAGLSTVLGVEFVARHAAWVGLTLCGPLGLATLLHLHSNPRGRLARCLSVRPLVAVGLASYSLYLIHNPVQFLLWHFVLHPLGWADRGDLTFAAYCLFGIPATAAAVWAFYRLFERPFLRPSRPEPAPRGAEPIPAVIPASATAS